MSRTIKTAIIVYVLLTLCLSVGLQFHEGSSVPAGGEIGISYNIYGPNEMKGTVDEDLYFIADKYAQIIFYTQVAAVLFLVGFIGTEVAKEA